MRGFVIFRDRVSYAQRCLSALLAAGLEPVIIDQGSSWPAALSWLGSLERDGFQVLRRGGGHPRGIWGWQPFRAACGTEDRYVVTDADVLPADDCPADWPARLGAVLDAHPEAVKAGLGLRTDNIPPHYARRDQVIAWEAKFWSYPAGDGAYRAGVDTALALYRPLSEQPLFSIDAALRTGPPYLADHLAWYEDLGNLSPELAWYYDHVEKGISHWAPSGISNWGD